MLITVKKFLVSYTWDKASTDCAEAGGLKHTSIYNANPRNRNASRGNRIIFNRLIYSPIPHTKCIIAYI